MGNLRNRVIGLGVILCFTGIVEADLSSQQRRDLSSMQREIRGVAAMIRRGEVEEAKELLASVRERVEAMEIEDSERDRSWISFRGQFQRAMALIPISFEQQVAPILQSRCLRCHGEDRASANLRMDTYANMARGGRSGALAVAGNPQRSLIMARVSAGEDQGRMPQGGAPLTAEEMSLLGTWIAQGARFDGEDANAPIGASTEPPKPKIKVVMADGSETVSFRDDVAPWMVSICLGCHSNRNARGGFSLETFEKLLEGGDSGDTVIPGNSADSYIWHLVGLQDPIKMPAGQALLKRSQAMAMKTWIDEGAHFDGVDPKAALRTIVPTAAELEAARLAAMSDQEFQERRRGQAESLWKQVAPRELADSRENGDLLVYGNVSADRLDQLLTWGADQAARLGERYPLSAGPIWRGRLIIFAARDRFDYEEFNTVLMNGRRTPASVSGHVVVTENFSTAYIALHDVGEEVTDSSLDTEHLLRMLISEAYLLRDGKPLPDWLTQGFGLFESGLPADSPFLTAIPGRARAALSTLTDGNRLFQDGTFAPEEVRPIGYLLTRYLFSRGNAAAVGRLLNELRSGTPGARAVQAAFGASPNEIARAFMSSL